MHLELVGLRPKLYFFRMKEKMEKKKCKGTKKAVIEKISFQDYNDCLFSQEPQT